MAICDPTPHPRFAIGESATPAASLALEATADEFDLPELQPFTRYGRWIAERPGVMRGLKRGFVYQHGCPRVNPDAKTLMAAASSSDEVADAHWLRADLDAAVLRAAVKREVRLVAANPIAEAFKDGTWRFVFERSEPIRSRYLLVANAVPPHLDGVEAIDPPFRHRSAMTYTHLAPDARTQCDIRDVPTDGLPFDPTHAAVHWCHGNYWGWDLRFDDGRRSVGVEWQVPEMLDDRSEIVDGLKQLRAAAFAPPVDHPVDAAELLKPGFGQQPADALAKPPGKWIDLVRPQRCCDTAGGEAFALLPHAFGFVTPLHSTGLMATVCAAPLAVDTLLETGRGDSLTPRYRDLLDTVDRLAVLFFKSMWNPKLTEAAVCHYLAAAISGEQAFDRTRPLLMSDDAAFRRQLDDAIERVEALTAANGERLRGLPDGDAYDFITAEEIAEADARLEVAEAGRVKDIDAFFAWSGDRLREFCPIPLCRPDANGLYPDTAAR